jgi:hypothetical protein
MEGIPSWRRKEIQGGVATEIEVFRLTNYDHIAACRGFLVDDGHSRKS